MPAYFWNVSENMLPTPSPNMASCAWLYWRTLWRAAMWPISCDMTPASSASSLR